ncbi:sulfotransferase family protein [Nocardioides alcanivorans]|uniref:sulfotransferase family protein n=1 Tax=Nocardioides alcanivorans TaxID=2897352 RepID=UPI001F423164|nr:sulfotransferase [Nocardioides alcanivorans]
MTQHPDALDTIEEFQDAARAKTGLDDFGDDDYLEGLAVLRDSFEHEADLSEIGRRIARKMIIDALSSRLISEAGFNRHPEHVDVAIERPIFVCGMTRTGTTALQRLLSADPGNQGIEMWLADTPQPRPPREEWPENPDFARADAFYRRTQEKAADLMKVHFMGAEEVEECWRLLQQSLRSVSFETTAHLPSYSEWLAGQDWTSTYARYKKNLQLIGLNDPEKRWVLKNPSHVFAIDEIMSIFPDALIVRTFRDPQTSMASTFSLCDQSSFSMSKAFDRPTIGRTQLDLWARGNAHFHAARERYDPEQFLDVDYREFVADPVGTVEKLYAGFSLPFSDAARAAVTQAHEASLAEHRRPSHQYALEDFGVTAEQVAEKFDLTS